MNRTIKNAIIFYCLLPPAIARRCRAIKQKTLTNQGFMLVSCLLLRDVARYKITPTLLFPAL
ncbi:MAG: hypothetical protein WC247_00690 [Porticoccaceae bacterium]